MMSSVSFTQMRVPLSLVADVENASTLSDVAVAFWYDDEVLPS